ncbi:MAG: hypothetical protein GY832_33345 [Chloroflexi bacterium]|nr:hypothetical protein [Chloroflexota bacterium]
MKHISRISILALLFTLLIGLDVHPNTQTPQQIVERVGNQALADASTRASDSNPFDDIQNRIESAGGYDFTAQVEQTLIPRPVPANIGKGAERVDSQVSGQVVLPDYAQMTLRFEAGANLPPLTIEQDGADTYLIENGERTRIQNPLDAAAPTGDLASYLHAATNVRLKTDSQHSQFTIYEFDIDGPRFAAYMRDVAQSQLPPDQRGAIIAPSPILQGMSGHGELWIDANGLPRRQIIDTLMPEINEFYDSSSHIVTDFSFAESKISKRGSGIRKHNSGNGRIASLAQTPDFLSPALFLLGLFLSILLISRPRWLHVPISILLVVIFIASPPLRGTAHAQRAEMRAKTPTLLQALGVEDTDQNPSAEKAAPAPFTNTPRAAAVRMRAAASSDTCGSGDKVTDSDLDGTTDYVELCLGTDRYNYDSDQDGITDTLEIQGFVFSTTIPTTGTVTFYGNPTSIDSNEDGLTDDLEWPAPVGTATEWDPDGDEIPNLWDPDNDGDGIPDADDIDPFHVGEYQGSFSLQTTLEQSTFDGYQYIEFQIQPENADHLRYSTTALDWPYDEDGLVQDLDDSSEDLTLTPILRITTDNAPSFELMNEYGITAIGNEFQGYILYVILSPVSDGGQITAFEGKVVYGPGDLQDIDWTTVELVWTANMVHDEQNGDDVDSETIPLVEYTEAFRFAGLEVAKSANANYAVLGMPNTPDDNRDLYQLMFGLEATFLSAINPDLDEVVSRFSNDATPITQTWGIPATDVAVSTPATPPEHYDAVSASTAATLLDFLDAENYPTPTISTSMASLIVALEAESGLASLADLESASGNSFTFNLANIPTSKVRALSMSHYRHDGSAWDVLDIEQVGDVLTARYGDPSATLAGLQVDYPDLTAADLLITLSGYVTAWANSLTNVITFDGIDLAPDSVSDADVVAQFAQPAVDDTLAYLIQANNLGVSGGGFVFADQQTYYAYINETGYGDAQFYAQSTGFFALGMSFKLMFLQRMIKFNSGNLIQANVRYFADKYQTKGLKKLADLKLASYTEDALGAGNKTRLAKFLVRNSSAIGKLFAAAAFLFSLGFLGFEIAQHWISWAGYSSPYAYEQEFALAHAITATVLSITFFVMGLFSVTLIFLIAFSIASLFGELIARALGKDFNTMANLAKQLISIVATWDAYTRLLDIDFDGLESDVDGTGLVAGGSLNLSDAFTGYIWRESGSDNTQLDKSKSEAWFEASAGANITVSPKQGASTCTVGRYLDYSEHLYWDNTQTCTNDLEAEFIFGQAAINATVELTHKAQVNTRYEECKGFIIKSCSDKTDEMFLPDELDSDQQWDATTIVVDVLPNTLDGVWNWNALDNPDRDGDGLSNDAESELGTSPDDWDSDDDGLSDAFETETQDTSGADPLDADTDDDGLDDGLEYQIGTTINDNDSDDDGLTDGEEFFHWDGAGWTGGGWIVTIDGSDYWTFSSPLAGDADGDLLNDASEKNAGSSPNGANDAPSLILDAGPYLLNPSGAQAIYVSNGQTVTASLNLYNVGGSPITETLSLCLPPTLSGVDVTTSGDRVPATQQSGYCYEWDFGGNNLLFLQQFQADLTAIAGSGTLMGGLDADLLYPVTGNSAPISATVPFVQDNTAPAVQLTDPLSGTILAGTHYVMGGYAQDGNSWIDHVQVTVPGGTYTATGASPWAYTWELPADGIVTISAVAYDKLGNPSAADAVSVTVDSLPPVITSNIPDGSTISSGESLSTTIVLSGTVSDNYAGLTRVQMRYNKQPWRTIWTTDTHTLNTTWSGVWELPIAESAQGEHALYLRAYDAFGNIGYYSQTVFIDLYPPTNELTNRTFTADDPPHVKAGEPITLYGVANDAGRNPLPADPAALAGDLHSISDATLWLQPDGIAADDGGVTVSWIGDLNGDRLGDLAVGFPGMLGGAGKVVIVTGAAGDWPIPNLGQLEFLAEHSPSYIGVAGAGLGTTIRPAGDFNGDGFNDVLIGDPVNERLFLIFGTSISFGNDRVLDGNNGGRWVEIVSRTDGESVTANFGAAGDVNDDTLGDLFVTTSSVSGTQVYLLLGDATPLAPQALDVLAGAVLDAGSADVTASAIGDVDDDFIDDFGIALDGTVHVFAGGGGWEEQGLSTLTTTQAIATFSSSDTPPDIVTLGDVDGDGVDDFAYTDGSAPVVVFGDAGQTFGTQTLGGFPAVLSGFLVSAGDVDKDGQGDLLIGNSDGDAYLVLGNDLGSVAATVEGVAAAASAPYVAGADLAGDGSSDWLLVPSASAAAALGYDTAGGTMQKIRKPFVNNASLPRASTGSQAPALATRRPMAPTAGDVTVGTSGSADYVSIQAAINSGASRVLVEPGVYAETITLTNNVLVAGSGADRTILTFPDGVTDTVLVSADGISNTTLMNLSLVGSGSASGETGLSVVNGADGISLTRTIVRDMGTAVVLDGASTDLDLKNNTFVGNEDGLAATNCASVDVRNTIFAYNTGTALQYNICAAIERHQYNLYWANGTDMTPNDPGGGEIFSDPLFEDYGAGDFGVADASPVIDAGAPGDPVPPGAGDFADIGHMEQTGSSFFADDDYCPTCENDGLIWGVDAFLTIQEAVDAAWDDLMMLRSDDPVQFSIGVGSGTFTESVVITGNLQLLGSGVNESTIQGNGGPAVTFEWAADAGVSGFTLVGGGSDPVGVWLHNGSNTVEVSHNLIKNNTTGISVTQRSSGWGEFNTIVSNTVGVHTYAQYNWFDLESSIVAYNDVGLQADGPSVQWGSGTGAIFSEYNLLYNGTLSNTLNYTNVVTGLQDVVGQDPLLTGDYAYLQAGSPALDTANPIAEVSPGGGVRADIGWHELLAAPISVLMGQGDDSVATESIGVGQVEYAIVPVSVVTSPITSTLPTTWTVAVLDDPGAKLTYWQATYSPSGDGLYRIYSRATDDLGNTETDSDDWYDGAFVVDGGTPVVSLTLNAGFFPGYLNWLLLEGEVVDYVGESFDIEEIYFEIDGVRAPAQWDIEPWTEDGVSPRNFHYIYKPTNSSRLRTFQAMAVDGAGNVGSSPTQTHTIGDGDQDAWDLPTVSVNRIMHDHIGGYPFNVNLISGTLWIDGYGQNAQGYEISLDGGATWQVAADGSPWAVDWVYTQTTPIGLDTTTIPFLVRATNHEGSIGHTAVASFTVDTAPPRAFAPIEFSMPYGYHLDQRTTLTTTWRLPTDGNGEIQALVLYGDKAPPEHDADSPTMDVATIGEGGTGVYANIGAEDPAGNLAYQSFGPWYPGSERDTDSPWSGGIQSINATIDGVLDIEHGEWLTPTEWLDDDNRPANTQSLYATWDGLEAYLAWQGGWWETEGTLWAYYDVFSDTGTTQAVTDTISLPFDADLAVSVESADIAYLWTYSSTMWISESLDLSWPKTAVFAHDTELGGTEWHFMLKECCTFTDELGHHRLLAFAVDDAGDVWSAFPTANALDGNEQGYAFHYYYEWPIVTDGYDLLNQPVSAQEPYLTLGLDSLPPSQDTVSVDNIIQYVAALENVENEDATGVKLALSGSGGLTYLAAEGATCSTCPAGGDVLLDVPTIAGESTHVVTVTAQLASDLTGIDSVTTTMQLTTTMPIPGTEISTSHVVDTDAPTVGVNVNPGGALGSGVQPFTGFADDGFGTGVATVEISANGSDWQLATGTQSWSADLAISTNLYVRATDYHSQTSDVHIFTFTPDTVAPIITPTVPALIGAQSVALIGGTSRDPAPVGALVRQVAVQLDNDAAAWQPANLYLAGINDEQDWLHAWALPYEDGITHTLRFRATDYGDNATVSGWYTTVVDIVPPAITVTLQFTQTGLGQTPVLGGLVTDGLGVDSLTVVIYPASGAATNVDVTPTGSAWSYSPNLAIGDYVLYVQADDTSGNQSLYGPFALAVLDKYLLTVTTTGNGTGTVTSDPVGIDCGTPSGGDCTELVDTGTVITLTAAAGTGSTFEGWIGGGCSGLGNCVVTMDVDQAITATFDLLTHTLTVNTAGDGTGSVDLDPTSDVYDYGTAVTLTAVPALGSYFGGWTGNLVGANNPDTLVMDGDKAVTATFSTDPPVTYTLTVHTIGSGTVDPAGGTYISGTVLNLSATPDTDWQFDSWSGGVIGTSNPVSLTMDSDKVITATFDMLLVVPTYTLTVNTVGSGSVTPDPVGTLLLPGWLYEQGTVVTLTAVPTSGSYFGGWTGALTSANNPETLVMDEDKEITATFSTEPPITYTLTVYTVGSGTADPAGGTYISGTVLSMSATADPGWQFVGWSGDVISTSNPVSLTMDGYKAITVTFDLLTHTLTVNTAGDGTGSVDLDPTGGVYDYGTAVTLTAVPDLGSYFGGWTGDLISADNPDTLVMDEDKEITATFSTEPPVTYTLTVQTVGSGTVDPAGGTYISGTVLSLSATPDPDWQFEDWSGDVISTTNPISVTMTGDMTVTATFTQSGFDIYLPLVIRNY